jgi:hypothetical protein
VCLITLMLFFNNKVASGISVPSVLYVSSLIGHSTLPTDSPVAVHLSSLELLSKASYWNPCSIRHISIPNQCFHLKILLMSWFRFYCTAVNQNEAGQKEIINYRICILLGVCHHSVKYTITHKTYTQEGTEKYKL